MTCPRILTVQDISCVGQCSMTVALPILSACGVETCILPTAVLSTHTGGFSGVHFRDLSEDIPAIRSHWQREGISFDAIYTGYLGSLKQIDLVLEIADTLLLTGGKLIVDPAMADDGKLYSGFDSAYVETMKRLCARADILLPNITESCLLTDTPYIPSPDPSQAAELMKKLNRLGVKSVVMTGVGFLPTETGAGIWHKGSVSYYTHRRIPANFHGTGDIFASAFTGSLIRGKNMREAVRIAADFTSVCVDKTWQEPAHWYGVRFEAALPELMEMLNGGKEKYPGNLR